MINKNYIFILLLFLFVLKSNSNEIIEDTPEMNMMYDIVEYNDSLLIIGTSNDKIITNGFSNLKISTYYDGKIKDIDTKIDNQSILTVRPKAIIDKKNSLWVNGNGIFNWINGKWSKFEIEDEYKELRQYSNLLIDKEDYIWGTAHVLAQGKEESIIFKFKNNEFTIVDKSNYLFKYFALKIIDDRIYSFNQFFNSSTPINFNDKFDIYEINSKTHNIINKFNIPVDNDPDKKLEKFPKNYLYVDISNNTEIYICLNQKSILNPYTNQSDNCCNETTIFRNGEFTFLKDKIDNPNINFRSLNFITEFNNKLMIKNSSIFVVNSDNSILELTKKEIVENSNIIKVRKAIKNEIIYDYTNLLLTPIKFTNYNNQFIILTNSVIFLLNNEIQLGIEDNIKPEKKDIIVYPNPVYTSFQIKNIYDKMEDISSMVLYNNNGSKIKNISKKEIDDNLIDLSGIVNGSYYLEINCVTSNKYIVKFIKNEVK